MEPNAEFAAIIARTSLKSSPEFDQIIEQAQASTIYSFVQPMPTATLRLFAQYLSTIASNTPRSDPRWQQLDLMTKGANSELGMPHRVADVAAMQAAAPPPPPDPFDLPYGGLILDDFERDLAAVLNKHGIDVRCRLHDFRLSKFVSGVLLALADVQGTPAMQSGGDSPTAV